jgi:hypothetical protein
MLTFIDFSGDLPAQKTEEMPRVRTGKFIHVTNTGNGKEYLVFSPLKLDSYHANILSRFCRHIDISGRWVPPNKRGMFVIDDPDWEVRGGQMKIDDVEKRLFLGGESMAYGPPDFSYKQLKAMLLRLPEFAGYRITI